MRKFAGSSLRPILSAIVMASLLGCAAYSPLASQVSVTCEANFEAGGQPYGVASTNQCFPSWDFEQGDIEHPGRLDGDARGHLRDGWPFIAKALSIDPSTGRDTKEGSSEIFVRVSVNGLMALKSFDAKHDHSAHHRTRIIRSLLAFKDKAKGLSMEVKIPPPPALQGRYAHLWPADGQPRRALDVGVSIGQRPVRRLAKQGKPCHAW
ncbi:MAG TPA: hypothetical protein VME63_08210 [Dyella sp.]|uniref:hypothetical protein n=1 Tax=Dyella sp. TaxID=1869338 RepID=UPI002CE7D40C|nr:hypothetical protein [Dyella sp.]HTV85375.1 hypothetical protein [Dyella sp.]